MSSAMRTFGDRPIVSSICRVSNEIFRMNSHFLEQPPSEDPCFVDRTVVAGGNTPYNTTITSGALPNGLQLDLSSGILSGTPAASGVFAFTVDAMDADSARVTRDYVLNVTAPLTMARSGYRYNRGTHRFVQKLTIRNNGAVPVAGPVSVMLKNLSSNATVANKTGNTTATPPLGAPYISVNPGLSGSLAPGESVGVTLEFENPSSQAIVYEAALQTGPGVR